MENSVFTIFGHATRDRTVALAPHTRAPVCPWHSWCKLNELNRGRALCLISTPANTTATQVQVIRARGRVAAASQNNNTAEHTTRCWSGQLAFHNSTHTPPPAPGHATQQNCFCCQARTEDACPPHSDGGSCCAPGRALRGDASVCAAAGCCHATRGGGDASRGWRAQARSGGGHHGLHGGSEPGCGTATAKWFVSAPCCMDCWRLRNCGTRPPPHGQNRHPHLRRVLNPAGPWRRSANSTRRSLGCLFVRQMTRAVVVWCDDGRPHLVCGGCCLRC